jgi:hypothetical protein
MRAAAKVSKATPHAKNVSVHKTVASDSVPPDIAKAPYVEPTNQQAPLMFSGTSLEEWPVLAKRTPPLKRASPTQPFLAPVTPRRREPTSSSTSTKVLVPLTSSKLEVGASTNKVLQEGMEEQVQQSTGPSPTEHEQEKTSMKGRTRVLSTANQNMVYVENASACGVVTTTPASYMKGKAKEVGQSPYQQPKNKENFAISSKSESFLLVCKENMVHKHQIKQQGKGGDVVAILPHMLSSIVESIIGQNKFRLDALEFVPSGVYKPIEECSETIYKLSHDLRTSHVDSTTILPNLPTSSI